MTDGALCCLRREMLEDTCPFSFYRVSVDVAPQFFSTVHNINRALPYLRPSAPLSRPGCWAYPDSASRFHRLPFFLLLRQSITRAVLEVGVAPMTFTESQTHFAMCACHHSSAANPPAYSGWVVQGA